MVNILKIVGTIFFHVLSVENNKSTQKFEIFAFFRICQAKMLKPLNLWIFWSEFDKLSPFGSFKLVLHFIEGYIKRGNKVCLFSC